MQTEQYEKLLKAANENEYMSIGINEDGAPVKSVFIPWELTASAFNMQIPELTISVSDLQDEKIMSALRKCHVTGCYIFCALTDYRFISEFGELTDLFILHGENIHDLSFVRNLQDLFMFYIEKASLPNLKPLIDACNKGKRLSGKCFGFYRCKVANTSSLNEIHFYLSELLIWPVEGDSIKRWRTVKKPAVFKFYK